MMMSEQLAYQAVQPATLDDFHRLVQDDHVRRYDIATWIMALAPRR